MMGTNWARVWWSWLTLNSSYTPIAETTSGGRTSVCVAMATTLTSSPSRAAGAVRPVKVPLFNNCLVWSLFSSCDNMNEKPTDQVFLQVFLPSNVLELKKSSTCCRRWCTVTASVWWRRRCWSPRPPTHLQVASTQASLYFYLWLKDCPLFKCVCVCACARCVALGYSVPNGVTRIPSVGEAPSHPSTRHPSVASTRLPSVGEESTHPLLVADEAVRHLSLCWS